MQITCWNMTFPGELENDVDGSFLYDFKLLGRPMCLILLTVAAAD